MNVRAVRKLCLCDPDVLSQVTDAVPEVSEPLVGTGSAGGCHRRDRRDGYVYESIAYE